MREPIFIAMKRANPRNARKQAPEWVGKLLKVPNGFLGFESNEDCRVRLMIDEVLYEMIETEFRLWSFHLYYDKAFEPTESLVVRFGRALIASAKPVSKSAIIDWKMIYDARKESGEFRSDMYLKRKDDEDSDEDNEE